MIFNGENTLVINPPDTSKETLILVGFLAVIILLYIILCRMMNRRKNERLQTIILQKKGRTGSSDASIEAEDMFGK